MKIQTIYNDGVWHNWFAWYPVTATLEGLLEDIETLEDEQRDGSQSYISVSKLIQTLLDNISNQDE